ncbi:MAG: hypothetical protein EKK55_24885 [Rhodocyclaceae bacterium]|nr:MAG: hypothetical protein EKK55_24885 [Rhodocyclaceae bacterium]
MNRNQPNICDIAKGWHCFFTLLPPPLFNQCERVGREEFVPFDEFNGGNAGANCDFREAVIVGNRQPRIIRNKTFFGFPKVVHELKVCQPVNNRRIGKQICANGYFVLVALAKQMFQPGSPKRYRFFAFGEGAAVASEQHETAAYSNAAVLVPKPTY